MKTTSSVLNKYRLLYSSVCSTYSALGIPAYILVLYIVRSYVESNSVLVADDDDTTSSAVSLTRRGGPRNDVWKCGIADQTSMPPLKCGCFGSAT